MGRQGHPIKTRALMAVVRAFLIGCAVLLVVGCAGVRSRASQEEQQQGHPEATKKEQTRSPEATASEEARCQGTRTYDYQTKDPQVVLVFTTNDIPGCPKGGLLLRTDKRDFLNGLDGDDVIRGLGGPDNLYGGSGNDKIYAGPDGAYEVSGGKGDDVLYAGPDGAGLDGGPGEDVLYGGDSRDSLSADGDGQRDKLYCGKGKDVYFADKNDYVDSSCEEREHHGGNGGNA
jgi:hypothetical protein